MYEEFSPDSSSPAAGPVVTEAERIARGCGSGCWRLLPCWNALFTELRPLGTVRAIVRAPGVWIARCLDIRRMVSAGGVADLLAGAAHFRGDLSRWASVYLTDERWADGQARSVRWFDAAGAPAFELHVPAEGWGTLDILVAGFSDPDQAPDQLVTPEPLPKEPPNDDIDVKELRAAWDRLNPRTPFSSLLVRFGIGRPQAYRLAGPSRAEPVDPVSVCRIACQARKTGRPLVIRVHAGTSSLAYAGPITGQAMADGVPRMVATCLAVSVQVDRSHSAWSVTRPGVAAIVRSSGVRRIESVAGRVCLAHRV
ncbi:MAG: hypothetical protein KF785_12840 [Gemmatimonadales bacterium]|nr:hypothetical protein [Gemmatimonadales bacterium]